MLSTYIEDCRLLRGLARVLELPAVATTTSFTYLHRIRLGSQDVQLTGQELVTACIYVAAKVEEVHVSANQLINSARILSHPTQQQLLQSLAPLPVQSADVSHQDAPQHQQHHQGRHTQQHQQQQVQQQQMPLVARALATDTAACPELSTPPAQQQQNDPGSSLPGQQQHSPEAQQQQQAPAASIAVVGDTYYQSKDALFTAEQILLRLMNFQLEAPQPHKYLLNYCKLLGVSSATVSAAVCLLNDAVACTGLLVTVDAAVLAAAVLMCCIELMHNRSSRQTAKQSWNVHPEHRSHHEAVETASGMPRSFDSSSKGAALPAVNHGDGTDKPVGHCHSNALREQQAAELHHLSPTENSRRGQLLGGFARRSHEQHGRSNSRSPNRQQQQRSPAPCHKPASANNNQHRDKTQEQQDFCGQYRSSTSGYDTMPDAVVDGSWVGLIGLQTHEVTSTVQQLWQLLQLP